MERTCTGCGATDRTVLVETASGDGLCRSCWRSTTSYPDVRLPATPSLDAWIARVEKQEAAK